MLWIVGGCSGAISIHAPVKGATGGSERGALDFDISIHAPVKGATLGMILSIKDSLFQSTLP